MKKVYVILVVIAVMIFAMNNFAYARQRCEQGLTGPQGNQGEQGPQGDQGEQGPQGDQGLQGDQGDQGLQGDQGEQGTDGTNGEKGDKGDNADATYIKQRNTPVLISIDNIIHTTVDWMQVRIKPTYDLANVHTNSRGFGGEVGVIIQLGQGKSK